MWNLIWLSLAGLVLSFCTFSVNSFGMTFAVKINWIELIQFLPDWWRAVCKGIGMSKKTPCGFQVVKIKNKTAGLRARTLALNVNLDFKLTVFQENVVVMLENLKDIKAKHSRLFSEAMAVTGAQRESMQSIKNTFRQLRDVITVCQQSSDVQVSTLFWTWTHSWKKLCFGC